MERLNRPNRNLIFDLSNRDPVIKQHLSQFLDGTTNWEETLILMVEALSAESRTLILMVETLSAESRKPLPPNNDSLSAWIDS